MGFDVTFHPVSLSELQRFLFDVVADESLAVVRSKELSPNPKHQAHVLQLYGTFPEIFRQKMPVGGSFAYCAAVIAGFLHPYWYARGAALTFIAEEHEPAAAELFVPLGKVVPSRISELPDRSRGMIHGNESASGFIPPERIAQAQAILDQLAAQPGRGPLSKLETIMDDDAIASLRAALDYCRKNQLGMIEASDVVVPIADQNLTSHANMRAPFLNRMEP